MATIYNSQLDAFELYHAINEENDTSTTSARTQRAILRALADGLSGSAGAAISNIATYPLDLIITRIQIQRQMRKDANQASAEEYQGLTDAYHKIIAREGWTGLYTGLLSDTGKTIADSFLFFLIYDYTRKRRLKAGGQVRKTLPALEELSLGFVAGSLTKLFTTPIANVVTRQQAASLAGDSDQPDPGVQHIAHDILREKGVAGFWSGYSASLVLTLNPSLTFFLFEFLKRLTLPRSRRDNPPALATFVLAATSKAVASSVTYPFSLAKTRLQAGNPKKEARDEDKVVAEAPPSSTAAQREARQAARRTIFSTVLTIAHQEGVSSLYNGLHLEVTKAFFSHGTTMLVKQIIARLLTRFSTLVTLVLRRVRRKADLELQRQRLASKARGSGHEYYDLAIKRTSQKMDDLQKAVQAAAEQTTQRLKDTTGFVADYVEEEVVGSVEVPKLGLSVTNWVAGKKDGD